MADRSGHDSRKERKGDTHRRDSFAGQSIASTEQEQTRDHAGDSERERLDDTPRVFTDDNSPDNRDS